MLSLSIKRKVAKEICTFLRTFNTLFLASQVALVIKNQPANAGDIRDVGSVPGSGRSPGEGDGNPLQYSCLEKTLDRSLVGYSP